MPLRERDCAGRTRRHRANACELLQGEGTRRGAMAKRGRAHTLGRTAQSCRGGKVPPSLLKSIHVSSEPEHLRLYVTRPVTAPPRRAHGAGRLESAQAQGSAFLASLPATRRVPASCYRSCSWARHSRRYSPSCASSAVCVPCSATRPAWYGQTQRGRSEIGDIRAGTGAPAREQSGA